MVRLHKSKKGHDAVWVIVDRLTKSTHFIPIQMTISMDKQVQYCMDNIV